MSEEQEQYIVNSQDFETASASGFEIAIQKVPATQVSVDDSNFSSIEGTTVQSVLESINTEISSAGSDTSYIASLSGNWQSSYTSVNATSANWDSVYTSVNSTSGNWDSVYTSVNDTSANWDSVYTNVNSTSGDWDSVYSSVNSTSGDWDSVYSSVNSTSSNWDSVYSSVNSTSGDWNTAYETTVLLSSNQVDTIIPRNPNVILGTHASQLCAVHAREYHFEPLSAAPAYEEGLIYYDSDNYTLTMMTDSTAANLQIGQENWVRSANKTGEDLPNGTIVYLASAGPGIKGAIPLLEKAKADSEDTSADTIGVVTHDIPNDTEGYVTTFGLVRDLNLDGYVEGSALYLSPTTAGAWTSAKPVAPNHYVVLGHVLRAHQTEGVMFVNVKNGLEVNELHDVYYNAATIQNNATLLWNSVSSRFEDSTKPNNWDSVYTSVNNTSGNWDSVYTSVCASSANWDSAYSSVSSSSYGTLDDVDITYTPVLSAYTATTNDLSGHLDGIDTQFNYISGAMNYCTNPILLNQVSACGSNDRIEIGTNLDMNGYSISGIGGSSLAFSDGTKIQANNNSMSFNTAGIGGAYNVLVGYNTTAGSSYNYNTVVGYDADAVKEENVVIGALANSAGPDSVVIGYNALQQYASFGDVVIGHSARNNVNGGMVIGRAAICDAAGSAIVIGNQANADGYAGNCVAIGALADLGAGGSNNASGGVGIGYNVIVRSNYGVAIGRDAKVGTGTAVGEGSIAIGYSAETQSDYCVAIGKDAHATASGSVQLGPGTNSTTQTIQFRDTNLGPLFDGSNDVVLHMHNGTTSTSFQIASGSGTILEQVGNELQLKTSDGLNYADVRCGSVTVQGSSTIVHSENVTIDDNIITLNANVTAGLPTENAGITVSRGVSTEAQFLWNELNDAWYAGVSGSLVEIATQTDITSIESDITNIATTSGNWDSTYTTVYTNSSNWESSYATTSGGSYLPVDSVDVDYTPTSYTATTNDVSGHLDGINNAIASLSSFESSVISSDTILQLVSPSLYSGASWKLSVSGGAGMRMATVDAIWYGTIASDSDITYAETGTSDLGDTSGLLLQVGHSSGSAALSASVISGSWKIKGVTTLL